MTDRDVVLQATESRPNHKVIRTAIGKVNGKKVTLILEAEYLKATIEPHLYWVRATNSDRGDELFLHRFFANRYFNKLRRIYNLVLK